MPGHHHRAGGLRQSNKKNKRSKASKRSLSRAAGGKIVGGAKGTSARVGTQSKANRRNHQQQKRDAKRQELLRQKRGIDGPSATTPRPPRVVGILSLGPSADIEERLRSLILQDADLVVPILPPKGSKEAMSVTCKFEAFRKEGSLTLLTGNAFAHYYNDQQDDDDAAVLAALDLARVCDVLLLVIDSHASRVEANIMEIHIGDDTSTSKTLSGQDAWDHLISERGDRILTALKGQGLPTPVTVLAQTQKEDDLDDAMTMQSVKSRRRSSVKRHLHVKKYVQRFATTEFGSDHNKVLEVDLTSTENEAGQAMDVQQQEPQQPPKNSAAAGLVRALCTMSCSPPKWVAQSPRSYLISDQYRYDAANQELKLIGYVRGIAPLDVHSLVHVPNLGTFQCKSIKKALVPLRAKRKKDSAIEVENEVIVPNVDRQGPLDMFAVPDALEGEQNFIGFDEEEEHEEGRNQEEKFARPAGWSDYQAAWLDAVHDDALEGGGADHGELAEELNQKTARSNDDDMDLDEANEVSAEERRALTEQRRKEQSEHQEFPDEVEVDEDDKACERFARYRSLKSFRNSFWDPKENLPDTYASIFHFSSFKATQKAVMNDLKEVARAAQEARGTFWGKTPSSEGDAAMGDDSNEDEEDLLEGCIPTGSYVTLTLANVPQTDFANLSESALISAVSLLPHENKVSVLHMGLSQTSSCFHSSDAPVKSKDVLTFRCGWRTWKARPIFSQNNLNCDKHKFERFLPRGGAFFAASVMGPVTYTPCPVLVFRENEGKPRELIAIGSMIGADADRIVLKRIVLTGYPVRVHKRHATVKYMFYNPDDVKWFKPAGLYTKHGLQGNIVQSVGEHGTMKCLFNAPVKQHDTVCLPLYKRVYPKFPVEYDQGSPDEDDNKMFKQRNLLIVR